MITVDDRTGSRELLNYFPSGTAELQRLDYADFAFTGLGPDDTPWLVGIERKTISDLINSRNSGRFTGHQLEGLLNNYNTVYMIVEGMYKFDLTDGLLKHMRSGMWVPVQYGAHPYTAHEIIGFLNTLTVKADIIILKSISKRETTQYIISLHHWWTHKKYADHRSHLEQQRSAISLFRRSTAQCVAAELPCIGTAKSLEAVKHFKSIRAMANASVEDWMQIPGIGKTIAKRVVEEICREG